MSAMYMMAVASGGAGIVVALGLVSLRLLAEMPPPFADGSDDWLDAEMACLWWDEGIYWTARHA